MGPSDSGGIAPKYLAPPPPEAAPTKPAPKPQFTRAELLDRYLELRDLRERFEQIRRPLLYAATTNGKGDLEVDEGANKALRALLKAVLEDLRDELTREG